MYGNLSYDTIKQGDEEAMNNWRSQAIKIITEERDKGSYEACIEFSPIMNPSVQKRLALELAERFPISISHQDNRSPVINNENQWDSAEAHGYLNVNEMIAVNIRIRN